MRMRINVKEGEHLIVKTAPHPRRLAGAAILGLLLAPVVGFIAAFTMYQVPVLLQTFHTPQPMVTLLQIASAVLTVVVLIQPAVLRPALRYARNRTWLTNQRLVHHRFFPPTRRSGRRSHGFGTVSIDVGSIHHIQLTAQRGSSADVLLDYGPGSRLRLPAIPEAEKFVHLLQSQVSAARVRTNVEQGMFHPGSRWGQI